MAKFEGKCSKCGKVYCSNHKDLVVCDCWEHCPLCGARMTPYTPDLAPKTYGLDGKRDLQILMVCSNTVAHPDKSPFYSSQKPVEVEVS